MNPICDILKLMNSLNGHHNNEKIISLFVEGMEELFKPAQFRYLKNKGENSGISFEIDGENSHYGIISTDLENNQFNRIS